MCVKLKGSKMTPGQVHAFLTRLGKASGTWGFQNGSRYNVRSESIPTIWRKISTNRGILSVDSFWEKDKQFVREDGKPFNIGILHNDNCEFAVITVPAEGIVKPYHHRMPLLIDDNLANDFLTTGIMTQLSPEKINFAA